MMKRRAGTIMPTLPPDMPDQKINDLVDYLMTLKGQTAAATPAASAAPPVVSGCEACHGPGRAHAEAEQNAAGEPAKMEAGMKLIFKFDANPKENSERCLVCHETGKRQDAFGHSMHLAAGVSCQDCHSPHLVEASGNPDGVKLVSAQSAMFAVPTLREETRWLHNNLLKESQPQLCYQCHQTVEAQFALPEHHRVPEGFMKCTDCHNPHGTMNHFSLAKANWETCVNCHVEKRGPFVYEHAAVRVEGCVACHNPHGSVNNFLLKRREQRLLCLQCHTGFHTQAQVPHSRGGYQTSGDCTRCHVQIHGSNLDEYFLR
jgi:predicted CXXCH cytochrome family protein